MKFSILFITSSDLSGKSGHNIATKEIVEAFVHNDSLNVILICPQPKNSIPEEIKKRSAEIIYFKPIISIFPFSIISIQFLIWIKARKILTKYPDMPVVSRLGNFFISNYLIVKEFKSKYFLLVRGLSNFRKIYPYPGFNYLNKKISILNIKSSFKIYVAYKEIKELCCEYLDEGKIEIFNNAVNPSKFKMISISDAREQSKLNLHENDFVLGFVGSVQKRHHIFELIKSVENIIQNGFNSNKKNIKVLIIGEGPQSDYIKNYVSESEYLDNSNVIFVGFIDHSHVSNYISLCNLMYGVVSPATISNPIKCYEYLAAGRPVISSLVKDLEFIRNLNLGILVEDLEIKTISNAIISLYNLDKDELSEMGIRGRNHVLNSHNWAQLPKLFLSDLQNA